MEFEIRHARGETDTMINITDTTEGTATVVHPVGKMDTLTAKTFEAHLKKHIDNGQGPLLINMAGVDYVSSFGLRSLLIAAKMLVPTNRKYVLFGLNPQVHDVLRVSGFLKIIRVVASQEEALAEVAQSGDGAN
jgi:anti-sigma B factor antagonist